jgi:hypothetical protein
MTAGLPSGEAIARLVGAAPLTRPGFGLADLLTLGARRAP